jgi:RNA polymerase sigma-70 factor (TIGR02957 family)
MPRRLKASPRWLTAACGPRRKVEAVLLDEKFEEHRSLLFGVAYRILGSVVDAEDIVQDAWLQWAKVDQARVEQPRAYLVRTVSNLSLNRLREAKSRRESYVGPWLPEPLLTTPDVAEEAELAETISTAMLVVLESLTPTERAVFVLREAFGYSYAEVADLLDRSEPSVRQIAHRARSHVQARRPRFDADDAEHREITEKFRDACAGGDLNAVMELLAPDVVSWSDGGGKVTAARRPLHGADHVARWLLGVLAKPQAVNVVFELVDINGRLGFVSLFDGVPIGALTLEVADGLIHGLRIVVNPDKLSGLTKPARSDDGD